MVSPKQIETEEQEPVGKKQEKAKIKPRKTIRPLSIIKPTKAVPGSNVAVKQEKPQQMASLLRSILDSLGEGKGTTKFTLDTLSGLVKKDTELVKAYESAERLRRSLNNGEPRWV